MKEDLRAMKLPEASVVRVRDNTKKEQIQDAEKGIKNEISLSGRMQSQICKQEIKDICRCEMMNTAS